MKKWLKSKKSVRSFRRRGTRPAPETSNAAEFDFEENKPKQVKLTPFEAHRLKYKQLHASYDSQTGEYQDYTTILHSLTLQEHQENNDPVMLNNNEGRPSGESDIAKLSPEIWQHMAGLLDPKSAACLALSSKTLYSVLNTEQIFEVLGLPENYDYKLSFLVLLDRYLPYHLLCIPCCKYHRRIKINHESLKAASVVNPLFDCPNITNDLNPPPRLRISQGRTLPYTFVQLATRAKRFSPIYGIDPETLARRWKKNEWSLNTRYHIHEGRLLMRVVSQCFAPPGLTLSGKRILLFSEEDFWPSFSVCPHWRDGELMDVCKCALDHIPLPRSSAGFQGVQNKFGDSIHGRTYNPHAVPKQCSKCSLMRRCPQCPSEYLVEVKLTEDTSNQDSHTKYNLLTESSNKTHHNTAKDRRAISADRFRFAIVVTRWSDLGDGTNTLPHPPESFISPSMEWPACTGLTDSYDSIKSTGRRGISGIFESAFTHDTIPGRRMISMNPDNKTGGEERDDWY